MGAAGLLISQARCAVVRCSAAVAMYEQSNSTSSAYTVVIKRFRD